MRILIIGSDINAYSLAKKFSEDDSDNLIFVAPGNKYISDFATSLDIAESDTQELLDFALANEINLTVCTGTVSVQKSITDVFKRDGIPIFAPTFEAAKYTFTSSITKKFLYKNKVKTPKFAIFDKENMAIDYVRKSKYPLIIKNDFKNSALEEKYCYTFSQAKSAIAELFEITDAKVVVENYLSCKKVTQYFLTDGYTAFPVGGVEELNILSQKLNDQGIDKVYFSTSKVSQKMISKLMTTVIYPLLDEISAHSGCYVGIIGVELYVAQDSFEVIDFNCGFKKFHMQVILPTIQGNLYDYLYASTMGSLADDYNEIELTNEEVVAVSLKDAKLPEDVVFARDLDNAVFSAKASSLNTALVEIVDILDEIGIKNSPLIQRAFEEAVFYA